MVGHLLFDRCDIFHAKRSSVNHYGLPSSDNIGYESEPDLTDISCSIKVQGIDWTQESPNKSIVAKGHIIVLPEVELLKNDIILDKKNNIRYLVYQPQNRHGIYKMAFIEARDNV
jgi:hypothetical protein